MSNIPKSQLDAVDTRVEVMLRKLFEGRSVNFEDLNGVDILNADDEDTIFYNFTLDLWENHPLKTINGESLKGPGNIVVGGGGGSGTVTSVGLSAPSQFTVSGSPVTTSGTLGFAWNNQVANRVLAGPTTGADAAPTFRALVVDDIPGLPPDQIRNNTERRLLGWGEVVSGGGNGTLISLGTGFGWDGDQLDLSTNLQGWSGVAVGDKQDTLTEGQGIDITLNTISVDATADEIPYDNTTSGLTATDVQAAIDELETMVGGGGGLTHFTESVNTSAPNNIVPVVQFLANNAATNVDMSLTPKGTGAILAQIPDNTTTGGNKRGNNAVDFQTLRLANTQVALGQRSAIINGQYNTITSNGGNAFIGAGTSNTVSGSGGAVIVGNTCTASGSNSLVGGGTACTASGGDSAVVNGNSNVASGSRSFVGSGTGNEATGEASWIPGGARAITRGLYGAYAWSSARRASTGDNQCLGLTVQGTTTNATPTILTANLSAAGSTNVMVLPNNSCWTGTVHITGRSSGADVYYLRLDVVGARGANAAATTVKATNPAYTFTDTALVGVSAAVVANTTRGSLEVQVTGLAATTIDWFAHFDAGNQIVR